MNNESNHTFHSLDAKKNTTSSRKKKTTTSQKVNNEVPIQYPNFPLKERISYHRKAKNGSKHYDDSP